MPGRTGISVCDYLRKTGYQGAIDDRVLGLDTGADDYLVKPFEFAELIARIHALSRRSSAKRKEDVFEIGSLIFNRLTRSVQSGGPTVQLTSREFQLLDLLAQNQGQIVPREVIIDRIWGLDADVSSNNLDAYVRLLRKKISLSHETVVIQNVRGIGYKLEANDVC